MSNFSMNGIPWDIKVVDPNCPILIDRTNTLTVATTDPINKCIYLSSALRGSFLKRVFIHELGHCALFSYGLLDDIHTVVPREYWIAAEEWICNIIADYATGILDISDSIIGDEAWIELPNEIDSFIRSNKKEVSYG